MSQLEDTVATISPEDAESTVGTTAAIVTSVIGLVLVAVFVVLATFKFRRTQGRLWKFHAMFTAVVAVLVLLTPLSVKHVVFSSAGVVVAGTIFPFYMSLKALCTPSTADDMEWLTYWTCSGAVFFITAYLKDYQLASEQVQLYWYQFEFFFFIWLYLPFTDGATLIFDYITRPVLAPVIEPVSNKMGTWISGLVMTIINASHLWALWAFFIILPKGLKRFVTIAIGTAFPLLASITAVTTDDKTDDTFWLTYWSCYSLLFLIMDWTETWLGSIWGFYTVMLFTTVYLMLPMFQGSDKVFRHVLVPLAGLRESLLMRDAVLLKKDLMASIPEDRQAELRRLIAHSFNTDTPDEEDDAQDDRMEINPENAKLLWSTSMWNRKSKRKLNASERSDGAPANESTSLV
ncbi:receptor accessory protein [Seminavis robusta]|uniref:Receptor accessory protein n=1 Tax=Seminavis robusta TaxID=568900 RepID=A0A9N8DPR5_9STRA|nr:receptor accessory protein [Seminavis robusta]|eukprot:Sro266_g103180.1 receptor accessory protein (404) ;mRNA; f:44804-46210